VELAVGKTSLAEHDGGSLGKPDGQLHRDDIVRKTPNSVGAKEARHMTRLVAAR
jgi:hypothetical protein